MQWLLITNCASENIPPVKLVRIFQILAKMADTDVPEIELIIKASTIDGRRKGACIFCQVIIKFSPMDIFI